MDDVRDAVLADSPLDRVAVRDVAPHERQTVERVRSHDELKPRRIVADIETDYRLALVSEDAARPRPQATQGSGDEVRHGS